MSFHTAMSTAFPQPAPGTAPAPGPLKVPADRLRDVLGLTSVTFVSGGHSLALVDRSLSGASAADAATVLAAAQHEATAAAPAPSGAGEITIDNFRFAPSELVVKPGTSVTWVNRDDAPHKIASTNGRFAPSPGLDTGQRWTHAFDAPGRYDYFCAIHPTMVGRVVVR